MKMEFYQVRVDRKDGREGWVPAYPLALFETEDEAKEYALWKESKFLQNHRCVVTPVSITAQPTLELMERTEV